jgi:hypothetical protein
MRVYLADTVVLRIRNINISGSIHCYSSRTVEFSGGCWSTIPFESLDSISSDG